MTLYEYGEVEGGDKWDEVIYGEEAKKNQLEDIRIHVNHRSASMN